MSTKEVVIHALIYADNLLQIENSLKQEFENSYFRKIEQNSVLIFENTLIRFSVEYDGKAFYLVGRNKNNLENSMSVIENLVKAFKESSLNFSIDYQEEEHLNGIPTSEEFNISSIFE